MSISPDNRVKFRKLEKEPENWHPEMLKSPQRKGPLPFYESSIPVGNGQACRGDSKWCICSIRYLEVTHYKHIKIYSERWYAKYVVTEYEK